MDIAELEQRIASAYKAAKDDLDEKIEDYFKKFAARDAEQKALLDEGKITKQQYTQWRLAQIGRGKRFEALRDEIAERMTRANEIAVEYINAATPGLYAAGRNYAAYTIEQVGGNIGFTLLNEDTVRQLLRDAPDLMPYYPPKRAIKRGIDLAWGKQQITAQVTTGILQGEGVKQIADRLQTNIPEMNRTSALRAARTAANGAQNAGTVDAYAEAQEMGIELKKRWVSTLDTRTRDTHRDMDGQSVGVDGKFSNGCRYPGDPTGKPSEVYNCRCTMIAEMPEAKPGQRRARDPKTGRNVIISDMTYREWEKWKEAGGN